MTKDLILPSFGKVGHQSLDLGLCLMKRVTRVRILSNLDNIVSMSCIKWKRVTQTTDTIRLSSFSSLSQLNIYSTYNIECLTYVPSNLFLFPSWPPSHWSAHRWATASSSSFHTIFFMLAAAGWPPFMPQNSRPLATLLLSLLCSSSIADLAAAFSCLNSVLVAHSVEGPWGNILGNIAYSYLLSNVEYLQGIYTWCAPDFCHKTWHYLELWTLWL